jgi:hypothetical protein
MASGLEKEAQKDQRIMPASAGLARRLPTQTRKEEG